MWVLAAPRAARWGADRRWRVGAQARSAIRAMTTSAESAPVAVAVTSRTLTLVTDAPLDYEGFFRREFAPTLRTVELMLRDHGRAEELTQDAFVQLLRHWAKVSRYERPDAWVRRVAIRLAVRSL